MDADIDCGGDQFPAEFAVVGDFNRDVGKSGAGRSIR
jgi:hypothetical protein